MEKENYLGRTFNTWFGLSAILEWRKLIRAWRLCRHVESPVFCLVVRDCRHHNIKGAEIFRFGLNLFKWRWNQMQDNYIILLCERRNRSAIHKQKLRQPVGEGLEQPARSGSTRLHEVHVVSSYTRHTPHKGTDGRYWPHQHEFMCTLWTSRHPTT